MKKTEKQLNPINREGPSAPAGGKKAASLELGLTERRRLIRPLPVPEVVESDRDSVWGAYQSLTAEEDKKKLK
jgi:hypothetical protein